MRPRPCDKGHHERLPDDGWYGAGPQSLRRRRRLWSGERVFVPPSALTHCGFLRRPRQTARRGRARCATPADPRPGSATRPTQPSQIWIRSDSCPLDSARSHAEQQRSNPMRCPHIGDSPGNTISKSARKNLHAKSFRPYRYPIKTAPERPYRPAVPDSSRDEAPDRRLCASGRWVSSAWSGRAEWLVLRVPRRRLPIAGIGRWLAAGHGDPARPARCSRPREWYMDLDPARRVAVS